MTFGTLLTTIRDYQHAGISNLETLTTLINDTFGDWLASQGVSHLAMLDAHRFCLNVRGQLKQELPAKGIHVGRSSQAHIEQHSRFLIVALAEVAETPEALADALNCYSSDGDGAYAWVIPDGYMAALTSAEQEWEAQGGGYFSHESICISNTADIDTRCFLEVLYEDISLDNVSCEFEVPAHRSVHYRLDKLKAENGEPLIAKDAPVSYKITSRDARVVVQGSRILTSGEDSMFASFGTVMAWCPQ